MKLPWQNQELKDKIEELEASLGEKKEEIGRLEEMLEAEKERRSKLARQKQEAEEKLNRLEDKIKGLKSEKKEEEKSSSIRFEGMSLDNFKDSLKKIQSINSEDKDLVTVYSPGKLSSHAEISSIKNSIPETRLRPLLDHENIIIFYSTTLGVFCFKSRAFFDEKHTVKDSFKVEELLEFIEDEKHWALISRGESQIFSERDGDFNEVERITDRVNSQHGKGGFSQGRFERKRDEQVDKHLEHVEDALEGLDNIFLLGEKAMCQELPGKHLGGFDPNSAPIQNFYSPRRLKASTLPE